MPPVTADRLVQVRTASGELLAALERESFSGWDPWDALSSPALRTVARTRTLRFVASNVVKRSPVNLRPVIGVPKRRHTKALALAASASMRLGREDLARRLADEVAAAATTRNGETSWGYDFDVQTRWTYYPAGTPNAVVTTFAAHALLDVGDPKHAELVAGARRFALSQLLVESGRERYFAYYTGAPAAVHNSSLLVAGLIARSGEPGSNEWQAAADAVAYSVSRQRPDGSWPYGEGERVGFVDGYHTVYVLESLDRWSRVASQPAVDDVIECGLDLFLTRLVDSDGAARATLGSRYPVDTHACATAVTGLCRLAARDERALPAAERTLDWTLRRMRRRDGRFAFQRYHLGRNSVPYVRWSDAHMLLALATYLETRGDPS